MEAVEKLNPVSAEPLDADLVARFDFRYLYMGAVGRAAKISVSELKRRFAEQEEEAAILVNPVENSMTVAQAEATVNTATAEATVNTVTAEATVNTATAAATSTLASNNTSTSALNPALTSASTAVDLGPFGIKPQALVAAEEVSTGARWGTLMHEAMQWLPLETYTQESLSAKLDQLTLSGYFTQDERHVLNDKALYRFFNSDLGKRLLKANESPSSAGSAGGDSGNQSQVAREWPFSMLIEGHDVYPEVEPGEKLFLQGIVDTAFLEDDQWVVVDYKTDRVKSGEELVRRYAVQLRIYSEALERLTGKKVKERYIYSFRLNDAVPVPVE